MDSMTDKKITSPLLTEREACEWLRLTEPGGPQNPAGTLAYYRSKGLLRAVKCGRHLRYPLWELEAFVRRLIERGERDD